MHFKGMLEASTLFALYVIVASNLLLLKAEA